MSNSKEILYKIVKNPSKSRNKSYFTILCCILNGIQMRSCMRSETLRAGYHNHGTLSMKEHVQLFAVLELKSFNTTKDLDWIKTPMTLSWP